MHIMQLSANTIAKITAPQRLALPASNVAVGSVINLDFPILYVLYGNKELILCPISINAHYSIFCSDPKM